MALTEAYAGSATISTTEYSLPGAGTVLQSLAVAGVFVPVLDLTNLTATEKYRFKVYETINGNKRLLRQYDITGAQAQPGWMDVPFALLNGWDMTLTKLFGTDRAIAWSIRAM